MILCAYVWNTYFFNSWGLFFLLHAEIQLDRIFLSTKAFNHWAFFDDDLAHREQSSSTKNEQNPTAEKTLQSVQTGKTTTITHTAVRKPDVFRHHGAQLMALWNPLYHHNTIVLRDLMGAFNWFPIIPRDSSLSDSYMRDRWSFSRLQTVKSGGYINIHQKENRQKNITQDY